MKKKFLPCMATILIMILLLLQMPTLATEEDTSFTEYTFEDFVTATDLADNNELFAEYLEHTLYPNHYATFGISARARLSEQDRSLYDAIKVNLDKIANGESSSTQFKIDAKNLPNIENEFLTNYTESSFRTCWNKFWAQFDFDTIFNALLHDCTYEFYWFDKTEGGGLISYLPTYISPVKIGFELTFSFCVAQDYQPNDYNANNPTLDVEKTKSASNVSNQAHSIVKKYESLSDYQKLLAYKTEICNLVDYNHDAAEPSYDDGYGDPWQIIYVFDGLENTKVVCEGYAKAFQYLCDLSTFNRNIRCYTITGGMNGGTGAGGHMWNIVTMGNQKNYLVDVTNSDKGTVGEDGQLFLAGTDGSAKGGYQFSLNSSQKISFVYSQNMFSLWGDDKDSILNLAASKYDPTNFETQTITVTAPYQETVTIKKTHNADDDMVLNIESKEHTALPEMIHYVLVYDSHKILKDIRQIPCVVGDDGITLTVSNPHVNPDETYKVIVWTDSMAPLIKAIYDVTK